MRRETEKAVSKPSNSQRVGSSIRGIRSDFVLNKRNQFSRREVGINHPDMFSFMKLADNGDIEIMAAPGVGIIISAVTRSVTILADTLKIYTTEDDGIRWNNYSFNYAASDFTEPVLVPLRDYQKSPAYYGSEKNINDIKIMKNTTTTNQDPVTIESDYNFTGPSISKEITLEMTNDETGDSMSEQDLALLSQLMTGQSVSDMAQKLMSDSDAREATADAGGGQSSRDAAAIASGVLPFAPMATGPGISGFVNPGSMLPGLRTGSILKEAGLQKLSATTENLQKRIVKRIKDLVKQGYSHTQAKFQAERELLASSPSAKGKS